MINKSESTGSQRGDSHNPSLSRTPTPQVVTSAATRDTACRRPLRVLIVDGKADTADSLAKRMRHRGHDVRWTCDGASALKVALVHVPEVVLLDVDTPDEGGYELAQQLRLDARLKRCFLIAMRSNGHTDAWGHEQSSQADFDLFLAKPIDHLVLETLLMWEGERLNESKTPHTSGPERYAKQEGN